MASLILGITGKKRSGKDTFAARLIEAHGFTRLAFADPIKAVMADLNPYVHVEPDEVGLVFGPGRLYLRDLYLPYREIVRLMGVDRAKALRDVRRLLQAHGVAMREHVTADVWVDAVRAQAAALDGPVVITDVRFPNEADYINSCQVGTLLRIRRPGLVSTDTHVSETALDDRPADIEVANDADIARLHAQADAVAAIICHHAL